MKAKMTQNWDLSDTRNVVYQTASLTADELKSGYDWAYSEFYTWSNIFRSALSHESHKHKLKHLLYAGGWKKLEALWNFVIRTKNLNSMLPLLESILSKVKTPASGSNTKRGAVHFKAPDHVAL